MYRQILDKLDHHPAANFNLHLIFNNARLHVLLLEINQ